MIIGRDFAFLLHELECCFPFMPSSQSHGEMPCDSKEEVSAPQGSSCRVAPGPVQPGRKVGKAR